MARAVPTRFSRYLYCIPPHTHALMRFRVQAVTAAHVAIYEQSGVAVDTATAAELPGAAPSRAGGPVRIVPMAQIDVLRTWEGAPPEGPVYYSSVESYRRLHEMALARYGLGAGAFPPDGSGDPEHAGSGGWGAGWFGAEAPGAGRAAEAPDRDGLEALRRAMMAAHPDQGGSAEAFARAHAAYERARRQRSGG